MLQGSDSGSREGRSPRTPEEERAFLVPDHKLLRIIGEGSYGQVWLAQTLTSSYRAVKVVRKRTKEDERAFEREFRGIQHYEPVSRIHPSLVDILQVGRGDEYFYYVMELADNAAVRQAETAQGGTVIGDLGRTVTNPESYVADTLKLRLQLDGRLPLSQCIDLGLALTDALAQLHDHGLVHRDVKPSNIIYIRGEPKLTDIGLVARADASRSLVGTVGYIPPEGAGSVSADVFSLGRVLYQTSTGLGPEAYPEPPTDLDMNEIEAWAELNEVILKACGFEPKGRYASAREMHHDLERLKAGASIRRLRRTERRVAVLRRVVIASVVLVALIACGLFLQIREARRARQTAQENQLRLRQVHLANGIRAMEDGDQSTALVWLTEALKLTPPPAPHAIDSKTGAVADERLQRGRWEAIWRQCPRLVRLGAHRGPVVTARFSPDGRTVLTASLDHTACLWDLATGEVTQRLIHEQPLTHASFNYDGSGVVTCSEDGAARVWDAGTGQLRYPPLHHDAKVIHAAFSPDGARLVTSCADGTAHLWDAVSGRLISLVFKTKGEVNYAEFSPDSRRFVTASDDSTARVWDARSGEPVGPVLRHPDHVRQARFSPDGQRLVTASRDGNARIFDVTTGRLITPPLPHAVPLIYATFSPDGARVLAGGGATDTDGEVRVWDAATGKPIARPRSVNSRTRNSAFSPDGRFVATASHGRSVSVWDVDTGRQVVPPLSHGHAVWDVSFSADGRQVVSASRDGTWRVWDLATSSVADPVWRHSAVVRHASFTADGQRVLVSDDEPDSGLWDPASGSFTPVREPSIGPGCAAELSPSKNRLVTYCRSGEVAVYDGRNGRVITVLRGCTNQVQAPCFSPDEEQVLVFCRDNVARFWRTDTGEPIGPSLVHDQEIICAAFSPDTKWVATASGPSGEAPGRGRVQVWSVSSGRLRYPRMDVDGTPALAISPDGKWLLVGTKDITANPHFARVYDLETGRAVGTELWHADGVGCVAFTPDSRNAVTAGEDGACRVWDVRTGHATTPWLLHKRGITSLAFAPDGRRMVTSSTDGTARIWDSLTGEPLSPPLAQEAWMHCASFNHDGTAVVTGSEDRTCRIWRLPLTDRPTEDLETMAQIQSGRRLDETGGLSPITPGELASRWRRISQRHPDEFEVTEADKIAWHRSQADVNEAAHQWSAARFHLERMLSYRADDNQLRRRLEAINAQIRSPSSRTR